MLIKDICKIINGATPSTGCAEYWDGDIAWLTPKDLSGYTKRYISCGERSITQQGYNSCSTTLVPKDTILLTSRAPIGYLAMAEKEVCTNQGFKSIVCDKNKVVPLYLFYWLQTRVDYLKSISSGATFKELSKDTLENVQIELPDIQTQQHIVDTIGTIDDLIEFNNLCIQKSKQLIHQKYLMFNFETEDTKLGNCFDISIGRTPPTKENQWFSEEHNDVKWLSIKDMSFDGDYIFNTSQYLTPKAVEEFHIPMVDIGDLLLSFKLTVGRLGIAATQMVTNEAIACFKLNQLNIRYYLYCYLNNCNFLSDADNTSSIGQAINSTTIKNFKFKKPSEESLNKFNEVIVPLFEMLYNKKSENIYLQSEKSLLLKKYFA